MWVDRINSNSNSSPLTIPNGTKTSDAGLSGVRAIAQKGKNGRRGVVGVGVGGGLVGSDTVLVLRAIGDYKQQQIQVAGGCGQCAVWAL